MKLEFDSQHKLFNMTQIPVKQYTSPSVVITSVDDTTINATITIYPPPVEWIELNLIIDGVKKEKHRLITDEWEVSKKT